MYIYCTSLSPPSTVMRGKFKVPVCQHWCYWSVIKANMFNWYPSGKLYKHLAVLAKLFIGKSYAWERPGAAY